MCFQLFWIDGSDFDTIKCYTYQIIVSLSGMKWYNDANWTSLKPKKHIVYTFCNCGIHVTVKFGYQRKYCKNNKTEKVTQHGIIKK